MQFSKLAKSKHAVCFSNGKFTTGSRGLASYRPLGERPWERRCKFYLDDLEMSSVVIWPIESNQSNQYTATQLLKTVPVLLAEKEIYEPIKAFFKGFYNAKAKRKLRV